MDFIVLTEAFDYRVDAHNIIKSVLINEKGFPILRADLISKITDTQISDELNLITETEDVQHLPDIGQQVEEGKLYTSEWGMLKCRQTHNRTIYDPVDIPALFSFYREDSGDLVWIQGEYVNVGQKRIHNDVTYEVIQAHQTQSDWTPDVAVTLWEVYEEVQGIPVWVQPTGAQDAYQTGDQVYFPTEDDSIYESLIDDNVWSPTAYPSGWQLL